VDSWGVEFVDDGNYGQLWPSEIEEEILFPVNLLSKIVDSSYVQEINIKDSGQIFDLMSSISTIGLQHPVIISYSSTAICLADGHHRYLAFKNLGYKYIPAKVREVGRLSNRGISMKSFFRWFVDGL
jgi:hypothetical protein